MHADYVGSLITSLRWLASERIDVELYFLANHSHIGGARNECARYALAGGFDKLLFIDADQVWRTEDLSYLIKSDKSLIGGTYAKKTLPIDLNFTPLPEHAHYFTNGVKSTSAFLKYSEEADSSGEVEVEHIPTGFMLIDCSVLEKLKEKTPNYLYRTSQHTEENRCWDFFPAGVTEGRFLTEDFFFCSEARAAGFPAYLNVFCVLGHIGSFNYRAERQDLPQIGDKL